MHIGFITPEYPHDTLPSSGGLGTSIKNLAEALILEGMQVSVFVVGTEFQQSFVENSIRFYFIKKFKVPGFTWFFTRKYYQQEISKIVKDRKIDLLEAPDWTGITAFMKFNVPLVLRLHGSDAYFCHLEGRKQKIKNYWFEKNSLKNADGIIAVSNYTGNLTKRIFNLNKDISTIYNGIDINFFQPLNKSPENYTILYFGTVIRKKGVLELARAFNWVKKKKPLAKLKLIGKDSLDILTKESTLKLFYEIIESEYLEDITYSSHMPYSEIKKEVGKAGVVVLPSFAEAFPMTWLEAMAMEKAMVTSNIGWAQEIMIDSVTGFMVDPKDHNLFAERIVNLINDKVLGMKMGKQARERVASYFSSVQTTQESIKYYRNIIKN
jgi:L-malate glycosyltransferase